MRAGIVFLVVALMFGCSGGLDTSAGGTEEDNGGDATGQSGDAGSDAGSGGAAQLTRERLAGHYVLTRSEVTDRTGEQNIFESGEAGFEGELTLGSDGGFSRRVQLPVDDNALEQSGSFEIRNDRSLHIILPDCDYDSPLSFTETGQGRQLTLTMPEGACDQDREQTNTWQSSPVS